MAFFLVIWLGIHFTKGEKSFATLLYFQVLLLEMIEDLHGSSCALVSFNTSSYFLISEPDANKLQGSPSEPPVERSTIMENFGSSVDMESHETSPEDDLLLSVASAGPLFRSTINHLKVPGSSITSLGTESTLENKSYSVYSDVRQRSSLTRTPVYERKVDLYTSNLKMDPFRPLCMYELRGRCNNDECSWQHFKDFADDGLHQSQNDPPGMAENMYIRILETIFSLLEF